MNRKNVCLFFVALLLCFPVSGWCGGSSANSRPLSLGVRLAGGMSWSPGSPFGEAGASLSVAPRPYAGAGVFFHVTPRLRAGLDYSFTRRVSDWQNASPSAGVSESVVYRDAQTLFHGLAVRGEYNLLPASSAGGRLSLYAGAGAGCLLSRGVTYALSVSNAVSGAGSAVRVSGRNERHGHTSLFVPVSLSLEYAFLPQVSLSLGGEYRFIPGKDALVPNGQAVAALGLRFNFF